MSGSNHLFNTVMGVLKQLFAREDAYYTKRGLDLVRENRQLGGSQDGFRHMGIIYSDLQGTSRARGHYPRIHPQLSPEMESIIAEQKAAVYDRERIRQALVLVLRNCETWQDIRDAMPNGLKQFIPECAHLERTRPEAFTLADNPRALEQYGRLKEKIDYYVATQLLY